MNTFIETLNHWGENALAFAWPMLWQSSLLIVMVFALDYLLARRVRAAVRHALWLVVLVKLLLPPALALPTGATWWLWPAKPALVPVIKSETVTFDTSPSQDNFVPQTVPLAPPPPKLNGAGWAILASGAMSVGLLLSLLYQWLKVEHKTRRPGIHGAASGNFASALEQARQLAGLRRPMRLRLVDDALSPAVYGLFRPVILLPRALAEKLSAAQLRAVLLHEAIHLRRGDVRVNCAQTLLQIAYWWHPLLWLANARIRRLREEAVDDAVMVALRSDADAYAPTLLEVAKFAFRRPLASLGLVGILESRSALRQRVERLVDFQAPRRAGVTFLSFCGIILFGAVTLPMGQAPAITTESVSANLPFPPVSAPSHPTQILIQGRFLWMPSSDVEALTLGLPHHYGHLSGASDWMTLTNAKALAEINQRIHSLNLKTSSAPRMVGISGNAASIYVGNQAHWFKWNCTPFAADGQIDLIFKTEVASVSASGKTNPIEFHGRATMENNGGIVICAENPNDSSSNLVWVISAKTIEAAPASQSNSALSGITNKLEMRTFEVGTNIFLANLHREIDFQTDVSKALKDVISEAGVKLDPPKTLFFNDGLGVLFVLATPQDLDVIERVVLELHDPRTAFRNVTPSSSAVERKRAADAWVQVGKEFYNQGKSDVAHWDFSKALALDPDNQGAQYYLDLIDSKLGIKEVDSTKIMGYQSAVFPTRTTQVPFFLAKAGPDSRNFTDALFDSAAIHPSFQQVSVPVNPADLQTNYFQINVAAFNAAVLKETGDSDALEGFKELVAAAGMDLSPPKEIFIMSERLGVLYVVETKKDMKIIGGILHELHCLAPQVHIKARFVEMPSTSADGLVSGMGILTSSEMKTILPLLTSQNDVKELSVPEGVTITGRQMQMMAGEVDPIVTNYIVTMPPGAKVPAVEPQIGNIEFGQMFDVVPVVLADEYTISLKATGKRTQFFGYAAPKGIKGATTNYNGEEITLPVTLPAIQVNTASSQALLYDGQTLVLFPSQQEPLFYPSDEKSRKLVDEHIRQAEKQNGKKTLVVLVTATLIDDVGNRIHSDDEMPFAQKGPPAQPQTLPDERQNPNFPGVAPHGVP